MKNSTLLFAVLLVSVAAFGQAPMNSLNWGQHSQAPLKPSIEQTRNQYQTHFHSGLRTTQYWLGYGLDMDQFNGGGVASVSGNYLFPDSNVYVNFDDGSGGTTEGTPFVHELGDILDPLSAIFQQVDGISYTDQDDYYVDSLAISIAYSRMTDASVVDTMLVYLYEGSVGGSAIPLYYYLALPGYESYDTVFVAFQKYSHTTNKPTGGTIKTFKVPLTEQDSSSFYYFKTISADAFHVPAGDKVAMAVTFKPGYTYNAFDNIADLYNTFFFESLEENGVNTYPIYFPGEYNVSSIIPTTVRYNIEPPGGYNGLFIPAYAYTEPYSFEHHVFEYLVSDEPVGISNPVLENGTFHISPNPSSDQSLISFDMKEQSTVSINIYDLAGKLIQTVFNGNLDKGTQQQYLDLTKFANGIYMVTLKTGDQSVSEKLVVSR